MSGDNFERFKACAEKILAVDADKITMEAKFEEDLEADSLDLVELVMSLEEEFDIEVPQDDLENITTVEAAYNLVLSKLS